VHPALLAGNYTGHLNRRRGHSCLRKIENRTTIWDDKTKVAGILAEQCAKIYLTQHNPQQRVILSTQAKLWADQVPSYAGY
jgi:hypothetical protein